MSNTSFIIEKFKVNKDMESPIQLPYARHELVVLFKELGFTIGAEIGVDHGYFSEEICNDNPQVKLFAIDPWKIYAKYPDIKDQNEIDRRYSQACRRLSKYNCEIMKQSSMGAIANFSPRSLDFVYIDGNHTYDYVWEDLQGWSKIVKQGGLVCGHDYKSERHELVGVRRAVDKYMRENDIKPLFRFAKNNDSSWMFINE